MNRFLSWPIRTHLVIFISLLALPPMGLIVYSGLGARTAEIAEAKKQCLEVVRNLASEQQAVVAGVEQLVTALALLPDVQSRNATATNALLGALMKKNPHYANIVIGDASGSVWASAVPFQGTVSMADRKYYQDAVRTGMFSSGEYAVGKVAGRPMMSFGHPVKNAFNQLIAVIGVGLDLEYAQRSFAKISLPPGSSFGLLDHRGIILIRNRQDPFSEKLVGKPDPRPENFTPMTGSAPEGTFEALGNDGIFRLAAYSKMTLPYESTPYLYIRSSIPLASATAAARRAMLKSLTALAVLYVIGLLLVWLIGKSVIVNPVTRLMKASEQLAAGVGTVHVSRVVEGGELGRLARSFDTMAETLVQRESALRESEQRWATTLASIGDAVIATDTAGRIAFMNSVAEQLTGWTLGETATKPVTEVFNIINERTRRPVEDPVTKVLREGMIVGLANHTVLVKKDGTEVPIDDSGAPIKDREGNTMGVVLVFRDITERKRAEEAMRRLAQYPEENPNPVLRVALDGTLLYANPPARTMLDAMTGTAHEPLPRQILALVADAAKLNHAAEAELGDGRGRTFWFSAAQPTGEEYVNLYIREITERKLQEVRIVRLTKLYAMLSQVNEAIVRTQGKLPLYEDVCRIIAMEGDFPLVWIGQVNGRQVAPAASCGAAADYLKEISVEVDGVLGSGPTGTCIREDRIVINHDFDVNPSTAPWREAALRHGFRASAAFPLRLENRAVGALTLYALGPHAFDVEQVKLLEALSADISYGLEAMHQERLRREAEEALRRAHDELEERVKERTKELTRQANLLNLTRDAVIVRNREDRITFWNRGAEELYGWTMEEASGKIPHDLLKTRFPDSLARVNQALSTRGSWEGELEHTMKDDRVLTVSSRMVRWDEDGIQEGTLEVNRDVTERKQSEAQLRQAQKMEALGTLTGGIAHDFNNILAAMIGFTELVKDDLPRGSRHEHHLQRVLDGGLRGRELIRQLLTFARKSEQEKKPVRLSTIINETARLLRASTPSTISIRLDIQSESGVILGDPVQLQQVFMNLCANATYAMQEKGGVLDVEVSDYSVSPSNGNPHGIAPGLYMRLVVRDTGGGMSPDVMDKIFDPFFTTKKVGEGTGLGLSVVLGIVKQSHGYITVDSEPGKGSTFAVYFPKLAEEPVADTMISDDLIPTGSERVLFVDDEEALVEMGEELLAELGYEVISRTGSREALSLLKQDPSRFDVVITDQTMPEMTGVELARAVLAIRPDVPVILATGFSYMVDADSVKAAGIKGFVMKPLTKREIARAVRKVLDE